MSQTTPKHILQLVASSQGGAATHVRDLVLGLPQDQFQSSVAMPLDDGNVTPADFEEAGHRFIRVSIDRGFAWFEIQRLRQLLEKINVDLIHAHGARAAFYARLTVGGMRPRLPVVFSIHGFATPFYSFPKRNFYLYLEKRLQRTTSHTIAVAQAEADLFCSFGLTKPENLSVIPYGIDVDRFANVEADLSWLRTQLNLQPDNKVIVTVCRLNIPRDFASLLNAFKATQAQIPEARLLIVGDGPQRFEVETLIQSLGLTGLAQITGYRDDIPQLMALADIYTLTSYGWEGYPISTMEAQAAGTPVVVTDAGGSKEAVLHDQTGLVVPKSDAIALGNAFTRLLQNDQLHQQFGQAGQERAKGEFGRDIMVDKIVAVYDNLL